MDVVTFGSPCQDLSIAGKRAGIHEGERSNLFFEAIRIIREMREATNGRYPTFAVWENVPGAFSSNGGDDFRCVLEALANVAGRGVSVPRPAGGKWLRAGEIVGDGYSIAWRVLDAQYWGVPQRRKRIYLVADFAGGRAGEILFEREGLRGHPATGGAPGQGAAADAPGSAGGSRGIRCLNPWDTQTIRQYAADGLYPALTSNAAGGQNRQGVVYAVEGNTVDRAYNKNGKGWCEDVSPTLNTQDRNAVAFMAGQGAKARSVAASERVSPTLKASPSGLNQVHSIVCPNTFHTLTASNASNVESARQPNCVAYTIDNPVVYDARGNGDGTHCPTLTGDHENRVTDYTANTVYRCQKFGEYAADGTASTMAARDCKSPRDLVVEHLPAYGVDCRNAVLDEEKTHTLQAKANGGQSLNCTPSVLTSGTPPRKYIIRRLTPLECCRLQGFPDGWGVPDRKDRLSDEELAFWQQVRDTCASIAGKQPKKYSAEALTKWYNSLHTDSAEYKMRGNGIALPCAAFVLAGVAFVLAGGHMHGAEKNQESSYRALAAVEK